MYKILLSLTVLAFAACGDSCIDDKIVEFKASQDNCVGSSIIKYRFNNKDVYAFTQGQCIADGATVIYDKDCTQLCLLGGIAGLTKCGEIDFYPNAEEIEKLYEFKN